MPKLESPFKARVIKHIETELLVGSLILKNDAGFLQGVPDTLILFYRRWGALEFKRSLTAKVQPNQPHYVDRMNRMSFAAFICPENEWEVLCELERALRDQ